jgi:hypothetical protein
MLATLARELPADEGSWAAEFKWDGRAVAYVSGGALLLRSRLDRDITATYPDLAGVAGAAGHRQLILDGEIVASGPGGRARPPSGRQVHYGVRRWVCGVVEVRLAGALTGGLVWSGADSVAGQVCGGMVWLG